MLTNDIPTVLLYHSLIMQVSEANGYYCKASYTAKDPFKGGDLKSDTISVTVVGEWIPKYENTNLTMY